MVPLFQSPPFTHSIHIYVHKMPARQLTTQLHHYDRVKRGEVKAQGTWRAELDWESWGGPPEGGMLTLRAKGRVGSTQFVRVGVGLQSTPGGGDPDVKALSQRMWPSQGLWLGVRET